MTWEEMLEALKRLDKTMPIFFPPWVAIPLVWALASSEEKTIDHYATGPP